jgi:hypothetical protein
MEIFFFIFKNQLEKLKRNQFLSGIKIDLETAKTLDILSLLVPKFVRNRLAHGIFFLH